MESVTGTLFVRKFGDFGQKVQRETVQITNHGHPHFYAVPAEEYQRLRRLDRTVYMTSDLPLELRTAITKARPSRGSRRFNRELGG